MKVLATAYPSTRYRWFASLKDTKLEARQTNSTIRFYEIFQGKEKSITTALVKSLFPTDCRIVDRPFLVQDNKDFYTVLRRKTQKYRDHFNGLREITSQSDDGKIVLKRRN
jgi:hypothetical protein